VKRPSSKLHPNKEKDFSKKLEGMCPYKLESVPHSLCHPEEQSDEGSPTHLFHTECSEGSPIQLRGLKITPSKLPQENIKRGDPSLRSG